MLANKSKVSSARAQIPMSKDRAHEYRWRHDRVRGEQGSKNFGGISDSSYCKSPHGARERTGAADEEKQKYRTSHWLVPAVGPV